MKQKLSVFKGKNAVAIDGDRVQKTFTNVRKAAIRYRLEVEALRRLAGLDGIPVLLERSDDTRTIVIFRIPGVSLAASPSLPDTCVVAVREVVAEMLRCGVARHSLPPRDVIIRPDGRVGLVDFERITLRGWRFNPAWAIACSITRFHLHRLIEDPIC